VRSILLALLGGAVLLLAIACVNVASLVLVRSESRRREFVTEGLLLAVAGSVAGVLIASALMHLLARLAPKDMAASMPFLVGVELNAHTAAFAAATAVLAALLLATTPILRLSFQRCATI
jgi:hypothetical protein